MNAEIERIRKHVFGFDSFRLRQREIIEAAFQGHDILVVMPTGGGKSLCFQLPAMVEDGLTLVISPLISLMDDQVAALRQLGIRADMLHSGIDSIEQQKILTSLNQEDGPRLLYVSPERIMSRFFQKTLEQSRITRIVIDEAHCISVWGHDFRPEYTRLGELRKVFPQTPFMALTATADKDTRDDILHRLHIRENGKVFVSSFDRANITYAVEPKVKPFEKVERVIKNHRHSSGIIYCLSKKTTDLLTQKLQKRSIRVAAYHAGLSYEERKRVYTQFQSDELQVVVATIAFGMGIDKPNVRYVVHWDLPRNIESFYQESGRAGRDGLPAESIILFDPRDIDTLDYFLHQNQQFSARHLTEREREMYYQKQVFKQESLVTLCSNLVCRRQQLLQYFEEHHRGSCGTCDVCISQHREEDFTVETQKALSAIVKTRQMYGLQYIVDILLGKNTHQVLKKNHHRLSVFGVGADRTREEWEWIVMQLIGKKYIRVDRDNYRILKCQKSALRILKNQETIMLVPHRTALKHVSDLPLNLHERGLFEALRIERAKIAGEEKIPAYIVAQDSVLIELVRKRPKTLSDLLEVSGFGYIKQQKYGPRFLEVVSVFQDESV